MVFQGGSSSVLATAGHSQDGRNVAIWDTLLPAKKACVQSFRLVLSLSSTFHIYPLLQAVVMMLGPLLSFTPVNIIS